ncbi:hypothetical protein BDW59DRAFT_166911 [Aspergillus cavernicola]|uniref:SnoaL-like domain-containing protein n=1 Tax=Aspergillus cavernicola TaxID=176166 RepID=A0ABR4HI19_9EURO
MASFLSFSKKAARLCITADADVFDSEFLGSWTLEGFDVVYLTFTKDTTTFVHELENIKHGLSVSESYAVICFGHAAAFCLEYFLKSPNTARISALVAYYPTSIPDPVVDYPPHLRVLVHFANQGVDVIYPSAGRAHKSYREVRSISSGIGTGDRLRMGYVAYVYTGARQGFAEKNLTEYNRISAQLAWSRTLKVLQRAFQRETDLEQAWDDIQEGRYFSCETSNSLDKFDKKAPSVIYAPTRQGATGTAELSNFYESNFGGKAPSSMRLRLLSRTVSADRVVDELYMSFKHSQKMDWILPDVPPTNKHVEITLIDMGSFRGGKLCSEKVYWDQASVLVQAGLIDSKLVP